MLETQLKPFMSYQKLIKNNKFEIYNIASGKCVNLNKIILILENLIGKNYKENMRIKT